MLVQRGAAKSEEAVEWSTISAREYLPFKEYKNILNHLESLSQFGRILNHSCPSESILHQYPVHVNE